jgi:large subunit ribosomal protein L15
MDMAELSLLVGTHKRTKRRGRGDGSGLGKTSGRGNKGGGSRTGWRQRWFSEGGQMPIYRRLPKKGFSNARFKERFDVINVGDLGAVPAGTTVDLAYLEGAGLVVPRHGKLKVLGNGDLSVALNVRAVCFSERAKEKIVKAGGSAEVG